MSETRADLLSPSFIGGLAGMAMSGTTNGFFVGAVVVWLLLAIVLTVAAFAANQRERSVDALEMALEKRMARRGAAATR